MKASLAAGMRGRRRTQRRVRVEVRGRGTGRSTGSKCGAGTDSGAGPGFEAELPGRADDAGTRPARALRRKSIAAKSRPRFFIILRKGAAERRGGGISGGSAGVARRRNPPGPGTDAATRGCNNAARHCGKNLRNIQRGRPERTSPSSASTRQSHACRKPRRCGFSRTISQ